MSGNSGIKKMCAAKRSVPGCKNLVSLEGVGKWDEFWERVIKGGDEKCCFVLDLSGERNGFELNEVVEVPRGAARTVMVYLGEVSTKSVLSVEFAMGEGSRFGVEMVGTVVEGAEFEICVESEQGSGESHFLSEGRFVCRGGRLMVETLGKVEEQAAGSWCEFDTRVLQIGDGGRVEGLPRMEVGCDNVRAEHGFATGGVPEEALVYAGSRGLGRKEFEVSVHGACWA